jgi:hypothetical protein
MAEIRLQLAETEFETGNNSGSVAWLAEGLNIEKAQWVTLPSTDRKVIQHLIRVGLQKHIGTLGRRQSATEKAELLERRRRLLQRITSFERKGNAFLNLDDEVCWMVEVNREGEGDDEGHYSDDSGAEDVPEDMPETKALGLPSSLAPGEIERLGLGDLASREATLRQGQINDALEGLRMALGEKSLLFRMEVRNSKSQRTSLRAWQNVNKQDLVARQHKRGYDRARKALIRLDVDREYLSTLHDITPEDMKMSGDVTEENRIGQRSSVLAWFWRLGSDVAMEVELNPRMKECEYCCGSIRAIVS